MTLRSLIAAGISAVSPFFFPLSTPATLAADATSVSAVPVVSAVSTVDDSSSAVPTAPESSELPTDAPKTPLAEKPEFGGIYPTLAWFNDEAECGTGAVAPWADRLWTVTYGPHSPNGSSDKLYEIDADLNRTTRPESVGGTNANRAIHRETNQLLIGNHLIDANRNVRTIPHSKMFGRQTAVARHLTDPARKAYYLTMEEGLYEVDLETLDVVEICKDGNLSRAPEEDVLPGYHGKGGFSAQGRVVYANNGESGDEARVDPNIPSGCLAEWTPEAGWKVVARKQFTEVTGPDGICGGLDANAVDGAPLWSLGWDYRSVILAILDGGKWSFYRLPKGSHAYDGAHGWNTEWPRIREIGDPNDFLATMHGTFWRFPSDVDASNVRGIRPRSTYLKVIGDFAFWNGRVAFGCDDAAKSEFLNKSPFKNDISGPGRSNSNLWFVDPAKLESFGPPIGRGAVWFDDSVAANEPSDPYLFAGYDRRSAFVKFDAASDERVELTFEVDKTGNGAWELLKTVAVETSGERNSGFAWLAFPPTETGEWLRVRSSATLEGATCFLQYKNADERPTAASEIFGGIARPSDAADFLGARLWVREDNERLAVVSSIVKNGEVAEKRYYELTADARLERVPCNFEGGEAGTISRVEAKVDATPIADDVCRIDDKSALLRYAGRRYRLPFGSEEAARVDSPLVCRLDRETTTERDLLHCAGTFYELPAQNAGGLPKVRPIATDGRLIVDYASYRGMLVLAGIVPRDAAGKRENADSARIVRSEDGGCALWLGAVDDLWSFGKAVGVGSVWREEPVVAGTPSDPILATGFDKKSLELENFSDADVAVSLEADATANDDWREYRRIEVPAGEKVVVDLPDDFQAYWLRVVADRDATLTATFVYR